MCACIDIIYQQHKIIIDHNTYTFCIDVYSLLTKTKHSNWHCIVMSIFKTTV